MFKNTTSFAHKTHSPFRIFFEVSLRHFDTFGTFQHIHSANNNSNFNIYYCCCYL